MSARTVLVALTVILAAPAAADTGDDYSNNLFSDIAPLLALFGEQFAKQFMSQSMSWLDNIIFAMAPLGILTAIVAAIRVGGPPWLRAVVGRARENDAIVEMELKSSTSHEVCELWNGRGIVRTMGRPEVQQIIYLEDHQKDQKTFGLHTVESAMEAELLRAATYEDPLVSRFRNPIVKSSALRWKSLSVFTKLKLFWHLRKRDSEDLENNAILMFVTRQKSTLTNGDPHSETAEQESAPNISLNLHGGSKSEELYAAALCGIVLQFGMLVFCGFSVYHPAFSQRFPKNGRPVGANAFPIMALGTILLMVGMLICSAVVEQSTVETEYLRQQEGPNARLLWLQKSDTVSDQAFDSFVLGQSSSRRDRILTSRRQDNERTTTSTDHSDTTNHKANWVETIASNRTEAFTLLGVFFGLSGFILQFQGLRSMNWSASIAQLVCIFLMTIWRAWIRRGMIANPVYTKLREHHEMDWLALRIAKDSNFWPPDDLRHLSEHLAWEILTNDNNIACVGSWEPGSFSYLDAEKAQYALNIRQRLGQLTNWDGPASRLSIAVADSIEIVLNTLFDHTNHSAFTWSLKVRIGDIDGKIRFKVDKNIGINGMWEMDATHIEAALSLWLFHIHEKDESKKEESRNDWLRKDKSLKRKIRRLLGPGGSEALHRDIKWWIGDIDDKTKSNESNNVRQSSGFAGPVGFAGVEPSNTTQADVKVDNETSGPPLTVVSNVSLESSLAQHIFSSFMWAIVNDNSAEKDDNLAKQLNKDETSIVREDLFRIDNPETLLSLGLENKVLTGIANAIQQTGLGSLQEAYRCIIPALSICRKLPMEAVVEFIRQCTREHEMLGRWERVVPVYIKLFQVCNTVGTPSSLFQKVTAILIHLFMSISNTKDLREKQTRNDGIETLDKLKNDILKELKQNSLRDLTQNFVHLAIIQRRQNKDLWKMLIPDKESDNTPDVHSFFEHKPVFSNIMEMYAHNVKDISFDDANTRDIFRWTPLHYAAVRGDEGVVTELVNINGDPNASDLAEWTPMHYSIESVNKEKLASIVSALLRSGSDTEMRGRDGIGPLHCAAKQGYAQVIRILIQAGASVHLQDNSRKTPLHWAAYAGSVDGINTLLEKGAYVGARDDYGRTPLHLAAVAGWDKAVEKFMGVGEVERDSIDRDGRIPLHLAAIKGSEEVVRLLLDKNQTAAINTTDNNQCTPLDLAIIFGNENAAVPLSDIYNKENDPQKLIPFRMAILFGRRHMVRLWVARVDKKAVENAIKFANALFDDDDRLLLNLNLNDNLNFRYILRLFLLIRFRRRDRNRRLLFRFLFFNLERFIHEDYPLDIKAIIEILEAALQEKEVVDQPQ